MELAILLRRIFRIIDKQYLSQQISLFIYFIILRKKMIVQQIS